MKKKYAAALSALALVLLTGCPDNKSPKDPMKPPLPTTAPAAEPKPS